MSLVGKKPSSPILDLAFQFIFLFSVQKLNSSKQLKAGSFNFLSWFDGDTAKFRLRGFCLFEIDSKPESESVRVRAYVCEREIVFELDCMNICVCVCA